MINLAPQAFIDIVFDINRVDTDETFAELAKHSRCKAVSVAMGQYIKDSTLESVAHVEIYPTYAVVWDASSWELASYGHARRMEARETSRAALSATIEAADMLTMWIDNMMKDKAIATSGRVLWHNKLSALKTRDGILKVKELVMYLGEAFYDNPNKFL